ncbi:MAG: FAD-binding oxidoreductase [Acetobacteraceae bacterium]|nr:FAD-binding oxidoreductase [Acetobacteraceae bacterium]
MRGLYTDDFSTTPWWWEAARPVPGPPEPLPAELEVAIIGGGYTGLSAALTMGRMGTRALVLDAEAIGFGASSRNGGMVSGGLKIAGTGLAKRFGEAAADRLVREAAGSFGFLEELIARERIDCAYARTGRFVGAWTRRHLAGMERRAAWLADITGGAVRILPPDRVREELGSDRYFGGMVVEAAGGLHPARYVLGLAEAARQAGAILRGGVRAGRIAREGDGFRVFTSRGNVRAQAVLCATNGYSLHGPNEWLARRLIPVGSYIIATEVLPPATMQRLFPNRRMVSDSRRVLNYFRPCPEGKRVLWGGRASFAPTSPAAAAPVLHRMMTDVFPELGAARISHSWTGNVAFTFDFLPHIGVEDGVHYAAGCQGSGVAMQTWLGHQVALKILGRANARSAFDGLAFPTMRFYSGDPWFLPAVGEWYRLQDRIDRLAA